MNLGNPDQVHQTAYGYVLTCPNGRQYVGATVRKPKDRWNGGWGYVSNGVHKSKIGHAIVQFGWANFTKEVFELHNLTERELGEWESAKIVELGTLWPNGLNVQSGGHGKFKVANCAFEAKHTEEFRKGCSERAKKRWFEQPGKWKENMSASAKRRANTPEGKAALSKASSIHSKCPLCGFESNKNWVVRHIIRDHNMSKEKAHGIAL
jgi:hypothetical protein